MTADVLQEKPKLLTKSDVARRLGINYQQVVYAIGKDWLKLYQRDPDLTTEEFMFQYAKDRNIPIPE